MNIDNSIETHNLEIDNFKKSLDSLLSSLIALDSKSTDINTGLLSESSKKLTKRKKLLNIIKGVESMIPQFNLLQQHLEIDDKNNLQDQIISLKNKIREADDTIDDFENKLKVEQKHSTSIMNDNNILLKKNASYYSQITELEGLINSKNLEIAKLQEPSKNTDIILDIDLENNDESICNNTKMTSTYIMKMNDGNLKLIKQKNDKITELDLEISRLKEQLNMYKSVIPQLNEYKLRNNELENICISLEKNITVLSHEIKNNNLEHTDNLELIKVIDEFNLKKPLLKNTYTSLDSTVKPDKYRFCCGIL